MPLIYDDDAGWIAVDDDGMYDDELQNEINAAATASGVAGRDPGMEYRPGGIPNLGSSAPQTAPTFEHIGTPQITLENLARATNVGQAGVGSVAAQFMQDVRDQAQKEEVNPILQAIEAQRAAMEEEEDPILRQLAQYQTTYTPETPVAAPAPTPVPTPAPTPTPTPTPEVAIPVKEKTFDERLKELNDFLDEGNVPDQWEAVFADIAKDSTNPNQMWDLANKIAKNIAAAGTETFNNDSEKYDMLRSVYDKYGPQQGGWVNFAKNAGFDLIALTGGGTSGDIPGSFTTEDLTTVGKDVGTTISGWFEAAMAGGGHSWQTALSQIAQLVFDNKDNWAKIPGLSGQANALQSVDDVAAWILQSYRSEVDPTVKARLEANFGVGTYNLSNEDFWDKEWISRGPVETQVPGTAAGKDTTTMTKVNEDGTVTTAEVAPEDMPQYFGAGFNTTSGTADGVQMPQGTGQIPWAPGQAPGSPLYDPFTDAAERTFAQEYPGFARSQPGFRMPTIEAAYSRAQAPLKTQYGLQAPDLLMSGEAGLGDPTFQSAGDWLRSLTGGTGRILRGADLYGALQNVAGALTSDPNMIGLDPRGDIWRKHFGTAGQQAAAYAQPFLMATRGAPEARSALTEAIADAAARFEYQNPAGVIGAGGQRQGFLPWALEQNLLGINQMFSPETQRAIADPETAAIAASAGKPIKGFWDRPASETGAWY